MDTLTAPLGALIISVGRGIAGAQETIDRRALEHFSIIYDESIAAFEPLRAIGYQPTWYQVSEATAHIALALTVKQSQADATSSGPGRRDVHAAPVDAGYQSRFGYRLDAASRLKLRVVPVPPPAAAAALRAAPDVVNLRLSEARVLLEQIGIACEVTPPDAMDQAIVTAQRPAAGQLLSADAVLRITVSGR